MDSPKKSLLISLHIPMNGGTKPAENLRGSIDPRYLAGKPMVEWLRAVKKEISCGAMPDDEWRITIYYTDDSEKTLVFRDYDEAWDVFRSFVIQESLRTIMSVCFRGYSWTGRAVTRIAQLEYRR